MKDRLKLLLQEMNLTQSEFADYIGVGRSSITHIMTGRDKSSQTVVSKTLLKFPEINPMWLLKGEGEMYRPHVERTHPVSPAADEDSNGTQASLFPAEEAPVEVSQSVPPAQTVISVQPVQPVEPVRQVQPIQPVQPVQPIQPVQTVQQVQPVQHVQPAQPVQPVQPVQQVPVQPETEQHHQTEKAPEVRCSEKRERKLRKIVFFYDDRSFEEYLPDEPYMMFNRLC